MKKRCKRSKLKRFTRYKTMTGTGHGKITTLKRTKKKWKKPRKTK